MHGWTFMDSAACAMIDTHHGNATTQVDRMMKDGPYRGQKVKITAPLANETYNKLMGYVDRFDQLRASKKGFDSLELNRRRTKYTDKFDSVISDFANTLAYSVFATLHEGGPHYVDNREFRWLVHQDWLSAAEWITARGARSRAARRSTPEKSTPRSPERPTPHSAALMTHTSCVKLFPMQAMKHRGTKNAGSETIHHQQGRCAACQLEGVPRTKSMVTTGCANCDPPTFLHPGCFEKYHRRIANGTWQCPQRRERRKGEVKHELVNNKRLRAA